MHLFDVPGPEIVEQVDAQLELRTLWWLEVNTGTQQKHWVQEADRPLFDIIH